MGRVWLVGSSPFVSLRSLRERDMGGVAQGTEKVALAQAIGPSLRLELRPFVSLRSLRERDMVAPAQGTENRLSLKAIGPS